MVSIYLYTILEWCVRVRRHVALNIVCDIVTMSASSSGTDASPFSVLPYKNWTQPVR